MAPPELLRKLIEVERAAAQFSEIPVSLGMVAEKDKTNQVAERSYTGLLTGVVDLLQQARRTSARSVNAIITATYWEIGRRIVEHEQQGKERAGYGQALIERLAADLTARFGRASRKPISSRCGSSISPGRER